ncbi:hypothetical protein JTB14_004708 [Gonioctena quinquepunctata]|nr:hypothetical protein JTB14_004708 [Gonioctena quinquepunctata]
MMEREPISEIEITDDFVVEAIDAEHNETVSPSHSIDMSLSDPFSGYDSDAAPPYRATCEVYKCKREVFSSCHRCLILLCFDHYENYYDSCNDHSSKKARHNKIFLNESTNDTNKKRENNVSERYAVEGSEKEGTLIKVPLVNKQKVARSLRSMEEQNEVNGEKPSITTYRNIFRSKNLSFHKPKKDQCSLCITFRNGDDNTKLKLKDIYDEHNAEKIKNLEVLFTEFKSELRFWKAKWVKTSEEKLPIPEEALGALAHCDKCCLNGKKFFFVEANKSWLRS